MLKSVPRVLTLLLAPGVVTSSCFATDKKQFANALSAVEAIWSPIANHWRCFYDSRNQVRN